MAEKVLQKIGGTSGHGTFEVVDTDGFVALRLNGAPINEVARFTMPVPASIGGTTTLTPAQILNGFIIGAHTGAVNFTLPLGADLDSALGGADFPVGSAFVFNIRNDGDVAEEHISILANTGWTLSPAVQQVHAAPSIAAGETSFGSFAVRKTGVGTFTLYRVGA